MQLKGSGDMLVVAREIAWRVARWPLHFECAHLPKEFNLVADSLSRLAAVPPAAFPARLRGVPRSPVPAWRRVWRARVPE
eukprot:5693520-Pyramimonas_sp.AAC.1